MLWVMSLTVVKKTGRVSTQDLITYSVRLLDWNESAIIQHNHWLFSKPFVFGENNIISIRYKECISQASIGASVTCTGHVHNHIWQISSQSCISRTAKIDSFLSEFSKKINKKLDSLKHSAQCKKMLWCYYCYLWLFTSFLHGFL